MVSSCEGKRHLTKFGHDANRFALDDNHVISYQIVALLMFAPAGDFAGVGVQIVDDL